jgi:hypothetical protein
MKTRDKILKDVEAAKTLAFSIEAGCLQLHSRESDFYSYKSTDGKTYIVDFYELGSSKTKIKNPCAIIENRPAREVFDGFVFMSK